MGAHFLGTAGVVEDSLNSLLHLQFTSRFIYSHLFVESIDWEEYLGLPEGGQPSAGYEELGTENAGRLEG